MAGYSGIDFPSHSNRPLHSGQDQQISQDGVSDDLPSRKVDFGELVKDRLDDISDSSGGFQPTNPMVRLVQRHNAMRDKQPPNPADEDMSNRLFGKFF